MGTLKIFTWQVRDDYLYYLSQLPYEFYTPLEYSRTLSAYPGSKNMMKVPSSEIQSLHFDCIVFQSRKNYLEDQYVTLSERQRRVPKIYVEHDPPHESPAESRHVVNDRSVLLVHLTHYNRLMWNNGCTPTRVIEYGVHVPLDTSYTGEFERGIVISDDTVLRTRSLGADLLAEIRRDIPLDFLSHLKFLECLGKYRLFFNPIRYSSLGIAVCEAMLAGMPVVGLATTEMVTIVQNGVSGYLATEPARLLEYARELLKCPDLAFRLGQGAREVARSRFGMDRFKRDWSLALREVVS